MKPLLAILCLNLVFCSSISEQWRIQWALADWQDGRVEWNQAHAAEIAEVPQLADLP